ncbi:MAG TPA: sulfurtransferase [Candidatus Acidoferrum sp.]|nr:sulfurtransferase [Candidatus Acidoferrum sp.]
MNATFKRFMLFALFVGLLSGIPSNAQQKAATTSATATREPMLVTVDWLADHLNDPSLVLLQIGDKKDYDKGYIPGAQFLEYESISTPHNHGVTLMLELPPVDQLVSVFERLGVSNRSHVVLYFGTNWVSPTTRVYWTLDYLGLGDRTSILNGGLVAWEASHHPVSTEVKQPTKGSITAGPRKEIVADADWVSTHLNKPAITIIDARTHEFYNGSQSDGNPRSGHIPGATNLTYLDVVDQDNNKFKSADALKDLFRAAGLKPGNTMVSYCHIGQRATVLYFTAKMLGYDAKMYDGSWEDWSHRSNLPIVTGESPNKQ